MLVEDKVVCVVQVDGKVKDRLDVPTAITDDDLRSKALASLTVVKFLAGQEPMKIIVRAPKLVNIVLPRNT